MEERPTQPPAPSGRKKIRLTKSEAYAMGIASPQKKRLAFGLVGLLIAAALGVVLWYGQEWWLPYWLPGEEPAAAAAATNAAPQDAAATTNAPAPAAPAAAAQAVPRAPAPATVKLDFLSATAWNHPQFQQGVRLFNQALDRYRTYQRDRRPAELLKQIEDGALQAAMTFDHLQAEAPADVPLADCIARCQKLAVEARTIRQPAAARLAPAAPAPASAPAARSSAPPPKAGETWQDPDFLQGAKLFNQALEQYKRFLADKSHLELLPAIEETAFQAAKKFEMLQPIAPTNVPIGEHVSQCYRLIADCRRQNLESGGAPADEPGNRGKVVGPNRRPALPAYQPPAP